MSIIEFSNLKRKETIAHLKKEHFDLVVIGGGITGGGIALDAASRGLKVALVEKNDFASGYHREYKNQFAVWGNSIELCLSDRFYL